MNQELKQRLVGATVLIILGIIILPMLLDRPVTEQDEAGVTNIQLSATAARNNQQTELSIPDEVLERYEDSGEDLPFERTEPVIEEKVVQKSEPVIVPKPVAKPKPKPTPKPTPKPQVKPKSEVKPKPVVKTPPIKPAGKVAWAVQMASFSSKENANRLVQRMKSQKIPAYFERVDSNGKQVFRVRVGPLRTKEGAIRMKLKLDKKERLKTLVVTLH